MPQVKRNPSRGQAERRTERIGQLLAIAAGAAQALALERLGPLDLTPRAWAVVSSIAERGARPQIDLAVATGTDRTVMTYLLDDLERRGFVERIRDANDRRSYQIHLTRKGEELHRRIESELARQANTLLEPLDRAERRQLIELLARVADHWAQSTGDRPARPRSAQALAALGTGADAAPRRRPH
jgi:DNA-binding MarR family transcriptional regulator